LRSISPAILGTVCALSVSTGRVSPLQADAPAVAEPQVTLETAWVVHAGDREQIVHGDPPDEAVARLYTLRFRYHGDKPATRLQIVFALPAGERYLAGSATGPGANVSYSVDGGLSFAAAGELFVPAKPGEPEGAGRAASAADYSHLRWELEGLHPPGRSGIVAFRTRPGGPAAAAVANLEEQ
jgi:hypothetical protein